MKSWWLECDRDKIPEVLDALKKLGISVIESIGVRDNPLKDTVLIAVRCSETETNSFKKIPGIIRWVIF